MPECGAARSIVPLGCSDGPGSGSVTPVVHCPPRCATCPSPIGSHCARWKRGVFAWFEHRPDVSALFMSELSGDSGVVATNGRSQFETAVAGYRAAWRRLPGTVKHVIVIRDTPKAEPWTLDCVDRARRAHKPAGPVCVNRRTEALDADPAAVAARREHGRRVQLLDLTRIFCGPRVCYPVIGGALVHKDTTHLTATFARTLGEPLLRRLEPLTRAWQE
jgi:hypothetical protein